MMKSFKSRLKDMLLYPGNEPTGTVPVTPIWGMEKLGSPYGGWTVPVRIFSDRSVCYCIGAGEDITFDLELIRRFGAEIFSYDPTPRAAAHVAMVTAGLKKYHFFDFGIWEEHKIMKFYAPSNPTHVSHSIVNLQATDRYFEAECKDLSTVFRENGHTQVDLLKLDVEGAEYRILRNIICDNLQIRIICVEFDELHHPLDLDFRERITTAIRELSGFGYLLVCVEGCNYTFIKHSDFPFVARAARWFWTLKREGKY